MRTRASINPGAVHSLRAAMGIDDIRLLRSPDPRFATQLLDLAPLRPVSSQPPVRRDLSVVADAPIDAELLGDTVRTALGPAAEDLESLTILAATGYVDLSEPARRRLGLRDDQVNVLLRLVLCPLTATLTDQRANQLRDQVYAAVHRGPTYEWANP